MEDIKDIICEIATHVVSLLLGGGVGYTVGIKKMKMKLSQKGRDNVSQVQIGQITKQK